MITRYFMPYIFYQKTGDEYDTPIEHNGLYEEWKQVNQQALKTPDRMNEIIKNEEIDKEFSRRYKEYEKHMIWF